jgi:WD40 repeat protein
MKILKVTSVSYSLNNLIVASGSLDRSIRIWKVSDGQSLITISNIGSDVN